MTSALGDHLDAELDWLNLVIESAIRTRFGGEDAAHTGPDPPPLCGESVYQSVLMRLDADVELRLMLILALAPMLRPEVLDAMQLQNEGLGRRFSEFGGSQPQDAPFRPTVETALFLLAGRSMTERLRIAQLIAPDQPVVQSRLLSVGAAVAGPFSAPLDAGSELIAEILGNQNDRSLAAGDFPAQRLDTELEWDDLKLPAETLGALEEIVRWIRFGTEVRGLDGPGRLIQPGYRALFYGPPGTGKTLAATLLGQRGGQDVYRIDLSMLVSKWVGETERNLARVFDDAERRGWILFLDEADALFGKRTQTSGANDRYANQEVAFILQRIEVFDGVALMACNLKSNIDDAFSRRFQAVVHFPLPGPEERLDIWQNAFRGGDLLAEGVDLESIAATYDLSGGAVVNVIRTALLHAVSEDRHKLTHADLTEAIGHEYRREAQVRESFA